MINFTTISSPPKRNPLVIPPHFLPKLSLTKPRQLLIYFLSLWICLFWIFHINGIIYVIFCAWLLSLSIMFPMLTCVRMYQYLISFYIILLHGYIIRFIYPFFSWWSFGLFSNLAIMNNFAMKIHMENFCVNMFLFFGVYIWE